MDIDEERTEPMPAATVSMAAVAVDETDRLIASDKVAGTEVFDRAG